MSDPQATGDPVTLTQAAREKASEYLRHDKAHEVFRVSFDANGKLSPELDKLRPGDKTFVQGDVNVAIAEPLVPLLRGLTVDFGPSPEGKAAGFSFAGPPMSDPDLAKKAKDALAQAAAGAQHHAEAGHSSESDYMKIFFALAILTALELGCTLLPVAKIAFILLLMILAVTKAGLVGAYFMHLKFEGLWKYVLLVPPALLAVVLIFALMPDVGGTGAWPHDPAMAAHAAALSEH
jgi:cytochrome c oxidase subunit 4